MSVILEGIRFFSFSQGRSLLPRFSCVRQSGYLLPRTPQGFAAQHLDRFALLEAHKCAHVPSEKHRPMNSR